MKALKVGFIMFTEVGLRTQYLNWRHALTPEMGIAPEWITIDWWQEKGFIERLPALPNGVKARLRGQMQLRQGLAKGPFDALFIAGNTAYASRKTLAKQPYFQTTDVTPKQLYGFGELYGKTESRFGLFARRKQQTHRERFCNAMALFPWSHWAAASMVEDYGVDAARVHVVPPGLDVEKWRCPARPYDDGTLNILFVGGDFYRKGGDLLLEWAAKTMTRGWILHLVTRDVIATPNARVRVYNGLAPNDPTLMQLYQHAHLFALPTRGDCYSIASMEAMAAGLPVILSITGGTGDVIKDGETGYLIPPGDGDALTERLETLLANPDLCQKMGQAGRLDAEQRYDACKNIQRAVGIMRSYL